MRIEGHTSSVWKGASSKNEAYFNNMELSQKRTFSILKYVLRNSGMFNFDLKWAKNKITANGLSSSKLIYNKLGMEDIEASKRVEFRVLAQSCIEAKVSDEN